MLIDSKIIDEAFEFYNIDKKYKEKCYKCAEKINQNESFFKAFNRVYETLYFSDFLVMKELWNIKNINELFDNDMNPFVTNLMILLGYEFHKNNMKKYKFDEYQVNIHKKRVRECFENDLIYRKYGGVRISQMLWATYFIRVKIIEIGRLQYECFSTNDNIYIIKMHIPKGSKLDINSVKKSINDSKTILKNIFNINNVKYICNSWLLSNQIYKIIDKDTNISKFHALFNVEDGDNCISDILNFVYEIDKCDDYNKLLEKTSLQKKIKKQLLNGKKFYLGLGVLK
jgi:hypothetical protein